jgi:hypothetical protein
VTQSWVTKRKWQYIVGTIIGVSILAAGIVPLVALQAEKNKRQDDFQAESAKRDREIHEKVSSLACGFLQGIEKALPPTPLTGKEDPDTSARIERSNLARAAGKALIREEIPKEFVDDCPAGG